MVNSDGIPVVPRNRKSRNSVPNPSAEEKTTRNSVPWNQNRCKFSEFRSKPFRGREHNSEFLSVQQKIEIYSRNAVYSVRKDDFSCTDKSFCYVLCCCFVKLIFSAEFHSVPFHSELRKWLFRGTRNASE